MESEFWAAIGGAIVGSVMALLIQLIALREARDQRQADATDRKQALGHALIVKLTKMHSNFGFLEQFVNSEKREGERLGVSKEPWQYLRQLPNGPSLVQFTEAELCLVLTLGEDRLFSDLMRMDNVHRSTLEMLNSYGRERAALIAGLPADIHGAVAWTEFSDEEKKVFLPKATAVNSLGHHLIKRAKLDAEESHDLLSRLVETLHQHLNTNVVGDPPRHS